MADKLAGHTSELIAAIRVRANRFRHASLFVKIALLAGASAFVAIVQFLQVPDGQGLSGLQASGIVASIVVAVGAIFVALTEEDASRELAIAARAVEEARTIQESADDLRDFFDNLDRTIELYQAVVTMRGAIETIIAVKAVDGKAAVALLLSVSGRSLAISMGFSQADQWTICVFQAVPDETGRIRLPCIAHHRAIECDLEQAREWEEGVGLAGVCYSNASEIIIPDMTAPGLQTVFQSPRAEKRQYDDDRYRSLVAVPILVQGVERPWGIVVATNDKPDHFSPEAEPGAKTDEGARALAGMLALAVAATISNQT